MTVCSEPSPAASASLREFLLYFLRLGTTGFGGPIALTGYMQRDLVERRGWVSEQDYKEGLSLAQLASGPLAAQLAIYLATESEIFSLFVAAGVATMLVRRAASSRGWAAVILPHPELDLRCCIGADLPWPSLAHIHLLREGIVGGLRKRARHHPISARRSSSAVPLAE